MHHTAALLDSGDMYLWGAGECVTSAHRFATRLIQLRNETRIDFALGTADSALTTSSSRTRHPYA